METDYIIIGAGIAGCTLAMELKRRGKQLVVFDDIQSESASRVAAGLINPIVPRRAIPAWNASKIFPQVEKYYRLLERETQRKFYKPMPMFQIHRTQAESEMWQTQASNESRDFLRWSSSIPIALNLKHFGSSEIMFSGRVNTRELCNAVITYLSLSQTDIVIQEKFDVGDLKTEGNTWRYGNIHAAGIIFCTGTFNRENPHFGNLPIEKTWGDILTVASKTISCDDKILKLKQWLIPAENHQMLAGSNFIHEFQSGSEAKKEVDMLLGSLREWIPDIELIGSDRAARPTVPDRRPVLGQHPEFKNMFIYNGLGTRGCSLVTWLSPLMADHILHSAPLPAEVLLSRFKRKL